MMPIVHAAEVCFRRWNDEERSLGDRSSLGFKRLVSNCGKGGMAPELCLAGGFVGVMFLF